MQKLLSILVIEDVPEDARLIRDVLNQEPSGRYNLLFATRLDTGLKILDKGGIDAVLLDLTLGDSQGVATFNRAHAHSPQVPIIVMTGVDDQSIGAEILHAGGQDFLNKGFVSLCGLHRTIRNSVERERAKEKSRPDSELLHAVERTDVQFVTLVCEELRRSLTPLTATILAFTNETQTVAGLTSLLAQIRHDVESETRLLDDLVSYSRLASHRGVFEAAEFETVLERVLANLKETIDRTGAVITHDTLPSLVMDCGQMVQLFQRVLGGLINVSSNTPPRVHLAAERHGDEWIISFRDRGFGVGPEQEEQIFTVFPDRDDADHSPARGVGLAICRNIAERHRGRLWAETEPELGLCIYFAMPAGVGELGAPAGYESSDSVGMLK